jgi:3-phenylpropionate/cinnamic acid dioxygenase small subunit
METVTLNHAVTQLLVDEAACLDARDFERWLTFYTDDALYWVTGWSDDPDAGVAVIYDDRERMGERVFRLLGTSAYAQMPPSRTVHTLGPISGVREDGSTDTISARGTMIVGEVRPGDISQVGLSQQRFFQGTFEVELVRVGDDLKITRKIIRLLDREQAIYNLTFIL